MNRDGLAIGRLFGIEIRVSLTWALLIAFVTLLGAEEATLTAPDLAPAIQWILGAVVAAGFLISVLAHELSHGILARRRGVPVTSVTLGFVAGLAPLSIEAARPADELAIALVGPMLSLALGFVLVPTGLALGSAVGSLAPIAGALIVIGGLNLVLGLLSLLPGLPLDGGRVIRALVWGRSKDPDRANRFTARIGRLIGWTTAGVGIAIALIDYPTVGLLVLSLGWFLTTGARTLERRLGLERVLRGLRVKEAMKREVGRVPPNLTIDTFSSQYEGPDAVPSLAVVAGDRVLGVLGIQRLQRLGRRRYATTRAEDVMATPPQAPFLDPDGALWAAVELLQKTGLDGLAVTEDGQLAGMLTRQGIASLVRDRLAADPAGSAGA